MQHLIFKLEYINCTKHLCIKYIAEIYRFIMGQLRNRGMSSAEITKVLAGIKYPYSCDKTAKYLKALVSTNKYSIT